MKRSGLLLSSLKHRHIEHDMADVITTVAMDHVDTPVGCLHHARVIRLVMIV